MGADKLLNDLSHSPNNGLKNIGEGSIFTHKTKVDAKIARKVGRYNSSNFGFLEARKQVPTNQTISPSSSGASLTGGVQ